MTKPLHLNPPWSDAEKDALERLYKGGWRWPDIAAQVSSVNGVERTPSACQTRARRIGILDSARKGRQSFAHNYDDDIAAFMGQDRTISEMVETISQKHGVKVSASYVRSRAERQEDAYTAWRSRKGKRISDRVTRRNYRVGRSTDPSSRKSRLRAMGIPERSFYTVRGELRDMGVEHTEQDIIDICKKRRRA